jgi:hypothetical protein
MSIMIGQTLLLYRRRKNERVVVMLRPRRMGKTLFVSTLKSFHDVAQTYKFDYLFKGLQVHEDVANGKHKNGRYFVLEFDFSHSKSFPHPYAHISLEESLICDIVLWLLP